MADVAAFSFRPWVRRSCRRAGLWATGTVLLLVVAVVWQGGLSGAPLARALGVLAGYGLLFLASLAKIWWTAGGPSAGWDKDGVWFQALHKWRPTRLAWESILAGRKRSETSSYRLVEQRRGEARERFLNLAVIQNHHQFVQGLETELSKLGFEHSAHGWARRGWDLEDDHIPT